MVRLGFAVAAHLDPEILVVDEVLAVGDAEFQKKAIGKMQDVSRGEGRTVLFVSHNMLSISRLCDHGILLDKGKIVTLGEINYVINEYKKRTNEYSSLSQLQERTDRQGIKALLVTDCYLLSQGEKTDVAHVGDPFILHVTLSRQTSNFLNGKVEIAANICNADDVKMLQFSTRFIGKPLFIEKDTTTVEFSLDRLPITPGEYYVRFYVDDGINTIDWIDHAFRFTIENGDYYGVGMIENSAALLTEFSITYF